ncbi:hypothetical protein [Vannielia litorea]|uniref:Tripartite tricarboxylate transporter TctB family protein n=1 Tax=Vannielia litorea TaxID=1217970 RepID=A0A1N6GHN5_9RHOB|nr:hypothetical protein [Vannielia litorea]SIO07033.1 hypothetical protein SAMN05444002_2492 [Vannielia litorea]
MRLDLLLCALFALIFAAALVELAGYRWQVALAPALAAGAGLGLAGVVALGTLRHRSSLPSGRWSLTDLRALAWFAVALAAVALFGFALGGGLFVFAHALAAPPRLARLPAALANAGVVVATVWLLFGEALHITLWRGVLLGS